MSQEIASDKAKLSTGGLVSMESGQGDLKAWSLSPKRDGLLEHPDSGAGQALLPPHEQREPCHLESVAPEADLPSS